MLRGFWGNLETPFTVLAPMADVTDAAFRKVLLATGKPDVFYTEFVSADGVASEKGRPRLLKNLAYTEAERPIVAQFFGANPKNIHAAARLARELRFDGVDINMGCPERKVVTQGAGIGLCKTPELAKEVIAAAQEGAGGLPVSVKTRLGLRGAEAGEIEKWLGAILSCGISALTVHLRTMQEMSKTPAHWELVPRIKTIADAHSALLIGNGDVMSVHEAREKAERYGIAGVMIGRGIFHNPWLFDPAKNPAEIGAGERLDLLLMHTRLFTEFWGERKNFNVLKRFYKIYAAGWEGAKELRAALMEAKDESQVQEIIGRTPYMKRLENRIQ